MLVVVMLAAGYLTRCAIQEPIKRTKALEIVASARAEFPRASGYFKEYDNCAAAAVVDRKLTRLECRYKARLAAKDEKSLAQIVAYDVMLDQRMDAADLGSGAEAYDFLPGN